jgi:SAM-dependent methyltransferase
MSTPERPSLLAPIAAYYGRCIHDFGATPRGVDWNGVEGQEMRFAQLFRIIESPRSQCSVNDLGCGYGAMNDWLLGQGCMVDYLGVDISTAMVDVASARASHVSPANARFIVGDRPDRVADYGVASGIFNVCLGHNKQAWLSYMRDTLLILNESSRRGFAFNALTVHSDRNRMRGDLHYSDPVEWFEWCLANCSRHVALLHDYGLYEFTILVRKDA